LWARQCGEGPHVSLHHFTVESEEGLELVGLSGGESRESVTSAPPRGYPEPRLNIVPVSARLPPPEANLRATVASQIKSSGEEAEVPVTSAAIPVWMEGGERFSLSPPPSPSDSRTLPRIAPRKPKGEGVGPVGWRGGCAATVLFLTLPLKPFFQITKPTKRPAENSIMIVLCIKKSYHHNSSRKEEAL
jgi:hypothetical protein